MLTRICRPTPPHPVLLFDGVCNLCNGSVAFIIRRDPFARLRFASLQSDTGQNLLHEHGLDPTKIFSIIFVEHDRAYSRSSAAVRVARYLAGPWRLAAALWIIPWPIRDFLYDLVAKNRYRLFGKQEACMVPTPELRERFMSL